ncbi:MAG: hypothetical protein COC17_02505 [Hyphomicrobiales bacterium]|nr:Smr/MutS family protein [Hyphomicrobiales bacterium]PCH51134.1 MAG: hypothetical protein COC17_02505 [Hyphomicrobiales bacterium]
MRRKNTPKGPINIKSARKLKPEEVRLWQKVKRTIEPHSDPKMDMDEFLAALGDVKKTLGSPIHIVALEKSTKPILSNKTIKKSETTRTYEVPSYAPPISKPKASNKLNAPIDNPTVRKLTKGRLPIDARIDLHGMTQVQAHRTLLNFVQDAYSSSLRIVLVITGKGRINEGILRNGVPNWLQEDTLSAYVSGFRSAHITHGGTGALYVRIRKNKY